MTILLVLSLFVFPPSNTPVQEPQTSEPWEIPAPELVQPDPGKKKKLVEKLYEKTLVALTKSENAGIRCSAFFTLVKVDNEEVKEIFLQHLEDDERFFLGFVWDYLAKFDRVNQFMLELLHPERSKSSYRLTPQEYEKYRKLIYE